MAGKNQVGWSQVFTGKTGLITLILGLGVALPAINVYIVVTILPSLVRDIGGEAYYAWAATVFVAASLLGAVCGAKLFHKFGPTAAYSTATLVFALGTFACGYADTMVMFLGARLIQGLGGGFLLTLSYLMVRLVYPESLWPHVLSVISSMWGIATLCGPAIGGIFAEYDAWRMAFWLVGGLALLFALSVWLILPPATTNDNPEKSPPLAWMQIGILLTCVLVISIGSVLETVPFKFLGLIGGLALLFLLKLVEKKSPHKLLPQGSFSIRGKHFALYMLMLTLACAVNGSELYIPLFLQILHHVSPLWAGYIAALLSMGWTCGSLYSAPCQRQCQSILLIMAPCLGLVGAVLLFLLLPGGQNMIDNDYMTLSFIGLGLFLIGLCTGQAWPHLLTRVMSWADAADADRASTSITLIQIFSAALGSAAAGFVTNLAGLAPLGGRSVNIWPAQALFIGLVFLFIAALFFARHVANLIKSEGEV